MRNFTLSWHPFCILQDIWPWLKSLLSTDGSMTRVRLGNQNPFKKRNVLSFNRRHVNCQVYVERDATQNSFLKTIAFSALNSVYISLLWLFYRPSNPRHLQRGRLDAEASVPRDHGYQGSSRLGTGHIKRLLAENQELEGPENHVGLGAEEWRQSQPRSQLGTSPSW